MIIEWLKNLQRRRRIGRVLALALRTETGICNVMAAARLYYAILYGKQAPF